MMAMAAAIAFRAVVAGRMAARVPKARRPGRRATISIPGTNRSYPRVAVEDGTSTGSSVGMRRVRSRLAGIAR